MIQFGKKWIIPIFDKKINDRLINWKYEKKLTNSSKEDSVIVGIRGEIKVNNDWKSY